MLTKPRDPVRMLAHSGRRKQRRFTPLMLIGLCVPVVLALIGGLVFVLPKFASHAATAPNPNCTLTVPANPLSAQGLATPYQLSATDAAGGPCNEANANQSAFVQGTILDPANGTISIYSPLVIDANTQPLAAPTLPTLPANAIVSLHFGFNGTLLTLAGAGVAQGNCVNGLAGSVFGQFAYCNAPNLFNRANQLIAQRKITVPPLGTALDKKPCPTVRDFSVVDMDQSDNVQTQYITNATGQTAQLTAGNQGQFPNATTIGNPSDNALVSKILDPALGCTPWKVADLANPGTQVSGLVLDELQARQFQQAPIGLVPAGDEMVLVNNNPSLTKVNAYRRGVDQAPANSINNPGRVNFNRANSASTITYCTNIINTGIPRIMLDQQFTMNAASPAPATGNTLFTFLATRLQATLGAGGLNCVGLLNINNPVTLTTDGNGVTTAATIVAAPVTPPTNPNAGTGPAHPDPRFHHRFG
jgi:hypothetical protein